MSYKIAKINAHDWKNYTESAHIISFNEKRPNYMDRIDYTLMIIDAVNDAPISWITCKEFDSETVYWQHGGGFPGSTGLPAYQSYNICLEHAKKHYKRIFTLIENTNTPMLKMAMKVGFRIIGVKNIRNQIMLEHLIEF